MWYSEICMCVFSGTMTFKPYVDYENDSRDHKDICIYVLNAYIYTIQICISARVTKGILSATFALINNFVVLGYHMTVTKLR